MSQVYCSSEVHEAMKADPMRWSAGTRYRGIQMVRGEARCVMADCRVCGDTLYRRPPKLVIPGYARGEMTQEERR